MIVLATTARKGCCIGIFIERNRILNAFQKLVVIERNTCFVFFLVRFGCRKSENIPMEQFFLIYTRYCVLFAWHGTNEMVFGCKNNSYAEEMGLYILAACLVKGRTEERHRTNTHTHTTQKSKLENCSFYTHKMHKSGFVVGTMMVFLMGLLLFVIERFLLWIHIGLKNLHKDLV